MKNHFVSPQAVRIAGYIKRRYKSAPEHLWARSPDDAIFRRPDNSKWFAGIFHVRADRIKPDGGDAKTEILNLRYPPEMLDFIVDKKTVFAGWHMNKRHWITLVLDDCMQDEKIFSLLDVSYDIAGGK